MGSTQPKLKKKKEMKVIKEKEKNGDLRWRLIYKKKRKSKKLNIKIIARCVMYYLKNY